MEVLGVNLVHEPIGFIGADWENRTPVICMASKRLQPLDEICVQPLLVWRK